MYKYKINIMVKFCVGKAKVGSRRYHLIRGYKINSYHFLILLVR